MLSVVTDSSANQFLDNNDGTVTDKTIGITWQTEDDNVKRDWQAAKQYCRDLKYAGHDDWRLPNKYELGTIRSEGKSYPYINLELFPGTKAARYWSRTSLPYYDGKAFFVQFGKGKTSHDKKLKFKAMEKDNKYYVRCIRGKRKRPSSESKPE